MNKIRQFAGQTITYGLGHILSKIFFFLLITVYLTYKFKDDYQYGVYTDLYAYASLLIVLFSLRMDTAFFRFGSNKDLRVSVFGSALIPVILSSGLILVIGFLFAQPIAETLHYPDRPHYVRWFAAILAFDILALLPFARLRLENRARTFVLTKIFNVLFTTALVLLFLEVLPFDKIGSGFLSFIPKLPYEVDYVFLANLISSCVVLIVLLKLMGSIKLNFDRTQIKKMLYYSFPLIIVGVCGSFNQFFAVPLQKYLLGSSVVDNISNAGTYGASQKIASIFILFTTAFNYAAEPFFFNNREEEDKQNLYGQICRLFVLLGGVLVLVITLGLDLFKFLIDGSMREAIYLVPILLVAYLFLGIYYNVSIWYKLADKTKYGAIISIVGVVITAVISLIYLPIIGYDASAWAALATFIVMVILAYALGQKHFPINYPVGKIFFNILIIAGIVFLSTVLKDRLESTLYYLSNGLLLAIYLMYVWYAEKEQWLGLFNRNRSLDSL